MPRLTTILAVAAVLFFGYAAANEIPPGRVLDRVAATLRSYAP